VDPEIGKGDDGMVEIGGTAVKRKRADIPEVDNVEMGDAENVVVTYCRRNDSVMEALYE
jgi:hypothetical protein